MLTITLEYQEYIGNMADYKLLMAFKRSACNSIHVTKRTKIAVLLFIRCGFRGL